ncbi:glycerate kinase, partial [Amycolatopsis cihanbeyliensis]
MTGPRVVVAPDKFKGSLTAVEAAEAIGAGVRDALPDAVVTLCPVADGGEGTLDVLLAAGGHRVDLRVRGPLDDPVDAWYVVLDGTAYLESARACGIEYVTPSPQVALAAHTCGVGELVAHALDGGARGLVLTVGGTASTDGGAGMLRALGAEILDDAGGPIDLGGGALGAVRKVDLGEVHRRLGGAEVRVATDVTNPLLVERGAAAVFGPQKGAGPAEVAE